MATDWEAEARRQRENYLEERRIRRRLQTELSVIHGQGRWHCETCACDLIDPTEGEHSDGTPDA